MFNAKKYKVSNYVKLEDGQSIKGVFVGEPLAFKHSFAKNEYYSADSPEEGSTKFWSNFVELKDGVLANKPKKFTLTVGMAEMVDLRVNQKGTKDIIFEITRMGVGKKTKYDVVVDRMLTTEECAKLAEIPLLELKLPNPKEEFNSETYGS